MLLCVPKKSAPNKNETELSDSELLRKRVQIFDPPKDLQWYQSNNSLSKIFEDKKLQIIYKLINLVEF